MRCFPAQGPRCRIARLLGATGGIPHVGLAILVPAPRTNVRLQVDLASCWVRTVSRFPLRVGRINVTSEYLTRYCSEPNRHRIPDLGVLFCGRSDELPTVRELLHPGTFTKRQRARVSRMAQ